MDFLFSRGAIMAEEEPKQDQTAEPSGSQAGPASQAGAAAQGGKAQEGAGSELASNTDRLTLKEVIAQQRAKLKEELRVIKWKRIVPGRCRLCPM